VTGVQTCALPISSHTDKLFVVDRDETLIGTLPLKRMLVHDPDAHVAAVMSDDPVVFHPSDSASDAAQAFERYDLVSAPIVDARDKLVGRLTVDVVMDYIRAEAEADMLQAAGLREEEDLFSTVWKAAKNRWLWLGINLITALIASRVVGAFEGSIEKLAALAALMPIVAGMGGNSGNQTSTLVVRGYALGLINKDNARRLLGKPVKTMTITAADETRTMRYSGSVRARVETALGFRVPGKIVERRVDIGARVEPGRVLARLDPTDLELALKDRKSVV
jgi:magnesium transporter